MPEQTTNLTDDALRDGVVRVGDLEIEQDLAFERRDWAVQRAGWVMIGLTLLAGALGLLGSAGPLNSATAGSQEGLLRVGYARVLRHGDTTVLTMRVAAEPAGSDTIRIWIDRGYLKSTMIEQVVPEPRDVEIGSDRVTYVFSVHEPGQELELSFSVVPERYWRLPVRVGLEDGERLRFNQFVLP